MELHTQCLQLLTDNEIKQPERWFTINDTMYLHYRSIDTKTVERLKHIYVDASFFNGYNSLAFDMEKQFMAKRIEKKFEPPVISAWRKQTAKSITFEL